MCVHFCHLRKQYLGPQLYLNGTQIPIIGEDKFLGLLFDSAGWLTLFLTNAGAVETNPEPITLNKRVWICDICYKKYMLGSRYP